MDLTLNTVSTLLRRAVSRSGSRGWAPEAALDRGPRIDDPRVCRTRDPHVGHESQAEAEQQRLFKAGGCGT